MTEQHSYGDNVLNQPLLSTHNVNHSVSINEPVNNVVEETGWTRFLPTYTTIVFVFTVCYSVLLQGIDYGIVMPSMWNYMQYHDANVTNIFFGAAMSSFSCASLLTAPAVGTLFDILPMRVVCLLLTAIGLGGSVMYGLAINNYMIIGGRILCGVSYNIFAGANVFVIRSSTIAERSRMFTRVTISFAIGTAMGPAINFPLSKIGHYEFGPFQLSPLSSPGYLMACLFFINGLAFFFLFREPKVTSEEVPRKPAKQHSLVDDEPPKTCLQEWIAIFSKFPVVVLIITQFLVIFIQSTVEVLVTPLTEKWYQFTPVGNSILFTAMTVCVVLALVIVGVLTKYLQDRALLMIGHMMTGSGTIVFVVCLVLSPDPKEKYIPLYQFVIVCMLYISSIAFYQSVLASLFSKLLDDASLDGRGQSVMSSGNALGAILGPLVSMVALPLSILYVPAIMGGLWVVVLFLLLISWHRMYIRHETVHEVPTDEYIEGIFDEETDVLAVPKSRFSHYSGDQADFAYTEKLDEAIYDPQSVSINSGKL